MQQENLFGDSVFVLRDFLTPEECAAFIAESEQEGYEDAPITMGGAAIILKDYRDNMRVMRDDPALAAKLFERAKPFLPETFEDWEGGYSGTPMRKRLFRAVGLNERFRFYRYDVGQTFAAHYDGSFQRDRHEASRLTFMVYLNADFAGGTTDFYHEDNALFLRVTPEPGMALIFRHAILHAGVAVEAGRRYVLRSDVMYRRAEIKGRSEEESEK